MDNHRPHVTMRTQADRVHVIPLSMFEGIAKGSLTVDCLDDRDELMRLIVAEWMDHIGVIGAEALREIED
jgi:hypothetical protein